MSGSLREIALSKLVPSSRNVRRTGADAGLDELIASIAAHGLLQSLVVTPVGNDKFQVLAGGRRLAALRALAKAKRLPKAFPVPAIVREEAGEEASLAENVVRVALHPADQFEAFSQLAEGGTGSDTIAARFGCSERLVQQRLTLGAVSPTLVQLYRDGGMTLTQLEAFTVTTDHVRQEAAWTSLSYNRDAYMIRRILTQATVPGRDRRVVFVGLDAYEAVGGAVARDLFSSADECWIEDVALLDRLAMAKLQTMTEDVRAEGWRWVEVGIDLPYGHGFRRTYPEAVELSSADEARRAVATEELEALSSEYPDDAPDDVVARMEALEVEIAAIEALAYAFTPDMIARGGAFVALAQDGQVRIERGFVRPEDQPAQEAEPEGADDEGNTSGDRTGTERCAAPSSGPEPDEDADVPALSDRLAADLSAHRTMALRDALGDDPEVALVALTHALVAQAFPAGRYDPPSCLAIRFETPSIAQYANDLDGGRAARAVEARHAAWAAQVPRNADVLWAWIVALDRDSREALLAHVVGLSVTAVTMRQSHRTRALDNADRIAEAVRLDMAPYWQASVEGYLGRVTKSTILQGVREGVSAEAAERLAGLRKPEMAADAERLLAGTGWVPAPLRTATKAQDASEAFAIAAE